MNFSGVADRSQENGSAKAWRYSHGLSFRLPSDTPVENQVTQCSVHRETVSPLNLSDSATWCLAPSEERSAYLREPNGM